MAFRANPLFDIHHSLFTLSSPMPASPPIDDTLARARRARIDGDWRGAELLCREVLDRHPVHPEATGLLGQILAEHDDLDAAAHYIAIAVGLAPNSAEVRLNSAALKDRQGDLKGALDEAKRASELDPSKFEVWATYGNFLGKAMLFEQAVKALRHAVRLNPNHPGAALLLAGACFELNDSEGANAALDLVDRTAPDLPQTLKLRAHVARKSGDDEALIAAAERWFEKEPGEESRMALSYGLAQGGYYARAAATFQSIAEQEPLRADYLATMGRHHLGARDLESARAWFDRALAVDPDFEEAYFGLARTATYAGDLKTAEAHCRRTIEIDHGHIDALAQLTEITEGRIGDLEFEALKALSSNPHVRLDARATAAYAYGDACHRRGLRADAFAAWTEANRHKTAIVAATPQGSYDPARQAKFTRLLMDVFAKDPLSAAHAEPREGEPTPIFIVGMPRSGTTLLENALSAHPLVAGGGELPALPYILDQVMEAFAAAGGRGRRLDEETRAGSREVYFRQIREFRLDALPFLTDKQPTNFLSVGLIRILFPQARIIHIRRNPLDTGFSIFRRNFSKRWPFAFDQKSIAHYYWQYARVMDHWRRNYPKAVAFVQYEDLIANFEGELRRLVDFCGLPWDESCVNYQTAERSVITFSAVQVRKGASKEHSGSAEPYRDYLKPMADALAEAGVDLETGDLVKPSL
jgi:tetratricopeptide (TPR) repeat protein